MKTAAAALAGALLLAPAFADAPPRAATPVPLGGPVTPPLAAPAPDMPAEFVGLFSDFCLDKFPDDDAVAALARSRNAEAMTPEIVKHYLHDDPGTGWMLAGQDARYALTIEQPPYHACAVRRFSDRLPSPRLVFDLLKSYVAAKGHSLGRPMVQNTPIGNGVTSSAIEMMELDGDNHPTPEAFMVFGVHYPGGQWEIRIVRQIHRDAS